MLAYEICPVCGRKGYYHPKDRPLDFKRCRFCNHSSKVCSPKTSIPSKDYHQYGDTTLNRSQQQKPFPTKRIVAIFLLIILTYIVCFELFGFNDAGNRTVIQYPWGALTVKFTPGIYLKIFGRTTVYRDVITFDFARIAQESGEGATIDQPGVEVRYRDGGKGTVFGLIRFKLPMSEEQMLNLHKAVRSNEGVAFKLLKPITEEALNLTAGLMTSEGAYADERAQFIEWADTQIKAGKLVAPKLPI